MKREGKGRKEKEGKEGREGEQREGIGPPTFSNLPPPMRKRNLAKSSNGII
jgi:hypothetical protein